MQMALDVPADRSAAVDVRRALEDARPYFSRDGFDDMRLLVTELVTNASRHAGLSNASTIGIVIRSSRERAHVEVTDPGHGFARGMDLSRVGKERIGGWGLRLVDSLAERWGVERRDGRTTVWFDLEKGSTVNDIGAAG